METTNALAGVRKLHEYGELRRHIFPSENSLTWFVRQHRDELISSGAMLLLNKQWHVNDHQFDLAVLEVGKKAAQQRMDEPPLRVRRAAAPPSAGAAA